MTSVKTSATNRSLTRRSSSISDSAESAHRLVRSAFSSVLANLIAASLIYLIGVGVGLLPRQSESVALSAFVVLITAGVAAEALGEPIYRRMKNAAAAAASSFRLITLAIILLLFGLALISSVFILRGSIDVWRLLLYASVGAAATVAGIRVLPTNIAHYKHAKRGPMVRTSSTNARSATAPRSVSRRRRTARPRRRIVAGRK